MCCNLFGQFIGHTGVADLPPLVPAIDQLADSHTHCAYRLLDEFGEAAAPENCMNIKFQHASVDRNAIASFADLNVSYIYERIDPTIPRSVLPL